MEAATRNYKALELERLAGEPVGSNTQLLQLPPGLVAVAFNQQHQLPDQLLLQQASSYVTCLKAAAAGLGTWLPPLQVLGAVVNTYKMLPGVRVAAINHWTLTQAAAHGVPAAVAAELAKEVGNFLMPGSRSSGSRGGSSSSSRSSTSASSSSVTAGQADPALVLLCGRTLCTAGRALQQLHEQPLAPGVTAAPSERSSHHDGPWQQVTDRYPCNLFDVALPLLGCVALVGPPLQRAVAESASISTSSDSSSRAAAWQQSLQQHELHATLAAASAAQEDSSNSSSSRGTGRAQAVADEVQLRAKLTADTAQQLADLGSGICVHLAAGQHWCCANPGCTNLADALERQLVAGKGTVCSACRSVRLCGPACNKAYWKAGHKQVCALFKQHKSQQGQEQ
jgi:hypothetical protein